MNIKKNYSKTIVGALLAVLVSALAIPVFAQSGGSAVVRATCVDNVATVEWSGFFGGRYSEAVSIYINNKVVASGMGTFGTLQKDVRTLDKIQAEAPKEIAVKAYGSKSGFVEAASVSCSAQPAAATETTAAATAPQFAPADNVYMGGSSITDAYGTVPVEENINHSVGTNVSRDYTPWVLTPEIHMAAALLSSRTTLFGTYNDILDRWEQEHYDNQKIEELPVVFPDPLRVFCYPPGYVEVWHTSNRNNIEQSNMVAQFHISLIVPQGVSTLPTSNGSYITLSHIGESLTIDAHTGIGQAKTIPYNACLEAARVTEETIPKMACNSDAVVQQQALIATQQAYVAQLEPVKHAVATRDEYAQATAQLVKLENALTALQAGCSQ